jgi:hypothetical protein
MEFVVDSENLCGYLHLRVRFSPAPNEQNTLHNSFIVCVFYFCLKVIVLL